MSLKSKSRHENGASNALSRVRVVCAFVAKALIRVDAAKHRRPRPCLMVQSVNMRQRTIPPLPKHSCGNLALHAIADCTKPTVDERIQRFIYLLSDAIGKTVSCCTKMLALGVDGREDVIIEAKADLIRRSKSCDVNALWFTDWSKFGLYEADFGWGKPIFVGLPPMPLEKLTVLMNTRDGEGIEAWVHLNTSDIPYLELDEEINRLNSQPN